MGLAARLERLVPDLSATLVRFPVAAGLSVALCIYFNIVGASGSGDQLSVAAGAAAAFIGAGAAHLFAEGRGLSRVAGLLLALAVAAAIGAVGYFTRLFETNLIFLFAGLIPVLMISPYLRGSVEQGAIWLYNLRFGLAALLAFVVALLFAAGLSAIVEALHILFGASLSDLHEHIWLTAMSLVAPLYGLSLMPRELDEAIDVTAQSGSLLDRGISVLVNYVAVPVVLVYAAILHAYAVKIAIERELPEGLIGAMVSIFAVGGTAVWLIAWPWRDRGTRLLRLFMRFWFFLLIVPAVLLAVAIWRRLADYGVTPDRYGIVLVAIWVAALTIYLAVRRNKADMRAILGAASVLLLVGSVGPMGADGMTAISQIKRLAVLLQEAGVLKDGRITTPAGPLPSTQSTAGYSIINTLREINVLDRLEPWFEGDAESPFASGRTDWSLAQSLNERLGFAAISIPAENVTFNANMARTIPLPPGAELSGPFTAQQLYGQQPPQKPLTAVFDTENIFIRIDDRTYVTGQKNLLQKVKAQLGNGQMLQTPVVVALEPGVTLLVDQVYGNLNSTPPLGNLRFWIIRQPQP